MESNLFLSSGSKSKQKKIPILVQNVNLLIDLYESVQRTHIPVWFDKAETILKHEKQYCKIINDSAKTLKMMFPGDLN